MTIGDPPTAGPVSSSETTAVATDGDWGGWGADVPEEEKAAADEPTADTADGAWGAEAPEEEKTPADEPTADAADGEWGTSGEAVAEEKVTASKNNETPPETAMEELHLTDNNNAQSTEPAEGDWGSGGW